MLRFPWFRSRRRHALEGLEDEIRDHLDHEIETNIARGLTPEDARRQALIRFGNVTLVQEDTRAAWASTWLELLRQDVRVGVRILTRSPGLSATAAVLIALVVGINTTIFTMVDNMVTRPAPGVTARGLVRLAVPNRPGIPYFSYPDYLDYASQTRTLRSLTAFTDGRITLTSARGSFAVITAAVETNYFDTIDIRPIRGRTFTASEGRMTDASEVPVILSDRAWQEYFSGSDDVIGQSVAVNGQPGTVVGVMPPRFRGAMLTERADVWMPLLRFWRIRDPVAMKNFVTERTETPVDLIGRLAEGQGISAAQSEFSTLRQRLQLAYPNVDRPPLAVVEYSATAGGVIPAIAPAFLAIFSIVTLLTVLIVSANVANLMLARAAARQRETAVRQSLGASRARIVRLMVAEGLAISLVAWAAACLMTMWATRAIPQLMPQSPIAESGLEFAPDWRMLGYALLLAAIGTVAFTIAPAVHAWRLDPLPWLKAGEHSVAQGRSRLSNALVILQLACSVVLLTSAGLATRSASMMTVDLGLDTRDLFVVTMRTTGNVATREANLTLIDRIRERLAGVPRVRSASYVRARGRERVQTVVGQPVDATTRLVGPEYLHTLQVGLVAGRALTAEDRDRSGAVAVINQNLAETLWPGQSALGQTMTVGRAGEGVEIVGVAKNAYVEGFNPERPDPRPNYVFMSEQPAFSTDRRDLALPGDVTFYLRHEPLALHSVAAAIGPALQEVEPRVAIVTMRTMEEQLEGLTFTARMIARLLAIFSAVSLLIAAIGQYAVIAFGMRRRVREFGVRIAMGASARQVLSAIVSEGVVLTCIGLGAGLLLSLGVAMAARRVLFGITPTDPHTYAAVFALLALVALAACCLPARAATRVDPVQALRQE